MRPLTLHIGPYGDVLRTSGRFSGTTSGRSRDVILPSGFVLQYVFENKHVDMCRILNVSIKNRGQTLQNI